MDDCIFCKIINGEINTNFLMEDEECVIFRDINPKAKTHLLIVPKKHIDSLSESSDNDKHLLGHLLIKCRDIAEKLGLHDFNIQINNGRGAGQEIFHLHLHLMSNSST